MEFLKAVNNVPNLPSSLHKHAVECVAYLKERKTVFLTAYSKGRLQVLDEDILQETNQDTTMVGRLVTRRFNRVSSKSKTISTRGIKKKARKLKIPLSRAHHHGSAERRRATVKSEKARSATTSLMFHSMRPHRKAEAARLQDIAALKDVVAIGLFNVP
ncbi:hypothetical protein HDU85_005887 [Gaertneriomyces sp. JEL0708]|nr:hypothetical protein HDU85_005887 [Gaertneriomyces sp. JEL0708]